MGSGHQFMMCAVAWGVTCTMPNGRQSIVSMVKEVNKLEMHGYD